MRPKHSPTDGMGWLGRDERLPWMDDDCVMCCSLYDPKISAPAQAGRCCYDWFLEAVLCSRRNDDKGLGKYAVWMKGLNLDKKVGAGIDTNTVRASTVRVIRIRKEGGNDQRREEEIERGGVVTEC